MPSPDPTHSIPHPQPDPTQVHIPAFMPFFWLGLAALWQAIRRERI